MKNLLVLFLLFSTFALIAQENVTNEKPKWILGFGVNFIDNSATDQDQYFNISNQWNYIPSVSKVSAERLLSDQFSIEGAAYLNNLSSNKMQNGKNITKDQNYFGFDLNGKLYFGKAVFNLPAFDPYLVAGFGYNSVGDTSNQSSNFGLGFNYWLKSNFGLRLQTMGKYGFNQDTLLNNHIQHSAELVYKF